MNNRKHSSIFLRYMADLRSIGLQGCHFYWILLPNYHAKHVAPMIDYSLNYRNLLGAVWERMLTNIEK